MNRRGQAITEYILLLSVLVMVFLVVRSFLSDQPEILSAFDLNASRGPFSDLRAAYRHGDPRAIGYFDDPNKLPQNHPRVTLDGNNNFRIFIQVQR